MAEFGLHLQNLFCATELFQTQGFGLKQDSSISHPTCRLCGVSEVRSLRPGFSGYYLAATKELLVLALIKKLACSKKSFLCLQPLCPVCASGSGKEMLSLK